MRLGPCISTRRDANGFQFSTTPVLSPPFFSRSSLVFELGYRSYFRDISLVLGASAVHESHPGTIQSSRTKSPPAIDCSSFSFRMFIVFIPKDPHHGHLLSSFSRILYSSTGTLSLILVDHLERLHEGFASMAFVDQKWSAAYPTYSYLRRGQICDLPVCGPPMLRKVSLDDSMKMCRSQQYSAEELVVCAEAAQAPGSAWRIG